MVHWVKAPFAARTVRARRIMRGMNANYVSTGLSVRELAALFGMQI